MRERKIKGNEQIESGVVLLIVRVAVVWFTFIVIVIVGVVLVQ